MKDIKEEDRVLHGSGDAAPPDPTDATTFDFNDMAQRRARALAELGDSEEAFEEIAEESPMVEGGTQQVEPSEEDVDDGGSFEGEDVSEGELTVDDIDRRHKAQIVEIQDKHQRQLESLMRSMSPSQPVPQEEDVTPPDPDLDPGAYVEHKLRPLEEQLEQMNQATAQQEQSRRLEMVQSYLDDKMSKSDVFSKRPNLKEDVRSAIVYQLFSDADTTVDNWESRAEERLNHFSDRYLGELPAGAGKADKVSRQLQSNRSS